MNNSEDRSPRGASLAITTAMGLFLGLIIGVILHNVSLGLVIGISMGISVGAGMEGKIYLTRQQRGMFTWSFGLLLFALLFLNVLIFIAG